MDGEVANVNDAIAPPKDDVSLAEDEKHRRQRRVFYVVGFLVIATTALQLGIKFGFIPLGITNNIPGATPAIMLGAFLTGVLCAVPIRKSYSAVTTTLFAAAIGMIVGLVSEPIPAAFMGAAGGFWSSVNRESPLKTLGWTFLLIFVSSILAAFLRFSIVSSTIFGWFFSSVLVGVTLLFIAVVVRSGAKARPDFFRSTFTIHCLMIVFGLFIGWHSERLFGGLSTDWTYTNRTVRFRPSWLITGMPSTESQISNIHSLALAHVSFEAELEGLGINANGRKGDLSALHPMPQLINGYLQNVTGEQAMQFSIKAPNLRFLSIEGLAEDASFEKLDLPDLSVLTLSETRVDGVFFESLSGFPALQQIHISDSQVDAIANTPGVRDSPLILTLQDCEISPSLRVRDDIDEMIALRIEYTRAIKDADELAAVCSLPNLASVTMRIPKSEGKLSKQLARLLERGVSLSIHCNCTEPCSCEAEVRAVAKKIQSEKQGSGVIAPNIDWVQ